MKNISHQWVFILTHFQEPFLPIKSTKWFQINLCENPDAIVYEVAESDDEFFMLKPLVSGNQVKGYK